MNSSIWPKEFPGSIIVCDREGIIVEMNDRAIAGFADEGGAALIGTNVLDCHPEPARTQTHRLLQTGGTNVYTIEKKGIRKLIYQSPWYRDGSYAGLVEFSLVIPETMPHFIRDKNT